MKTIFTFAAAFLMTTAAFAHTHGQGQGKPEKDPNSVTAALERALMVYDDNRNGRLDPGERERMREDQRARIEEVKGRVYARYDTNRNGVLDPSEEEAFQRDKQQLKTLRERNEKSVLFLHRYDANKDGQLDDTEQKRMKADRDAYLARLRAQVLVLYDVNRNGVLDPGEKAALRAKAEAARAGQSRN